MQDINVFYDKSIRLLSYRKKELSILFKHAQSQEKDDEISNTLFRAFILLLYAHLEGTTKDLAKLFFEYLASHDLKFNKINHKYYLNYIKRNFSGGKKITEIKKPNEIAYFSTDINTKSNIDGDIFFEILTNDFCINSGNFTSKVWSNLGRKTSKSNIKRDIANRITQIKETRNSIGHGGNMRVDKDKIADYYKYFFAILDALFEEMLTFLEEERYLKK